MSSSTDPVVSGNGDQPTHKPYVPDNVSMPELTISALLLGSTLGIIFSASSLYLVLKVGMTVSASIPVSVLAITLFRVLAKSFGLRQATILENNIVQTSGSAGESIAFGVGVTMPALLLLGFQMDIMRVMVVSILGGLLGILAMIPLRRAFIVRMHGRPGQPGTLLYPEGTACAQVLISGEKGGTSGKTVFIGFFIAFGHKFITEGMNLLVSTAKLPFTFINRAAVFSGEMASELLGVGYIIGLRTSAIMMAGALLGYLVIIPIIAFAGSTADKPLPPGKKLISEMGITDLRNGYLLYIGAGCVAAAGIISMMRTMPLLVRTIRSSFGGGGSRDAAETTVRRTENDMPMSVVFGGSGALVLLLAVFLAASVGVFAAVAGALMVVLFGFLFVTVSARLTGEIGSSSNPISGMTVATLTLTCLIFLALGWTSSIDRVLALSVAAVVCVAASNGGTTAQSLKTGFLVGGTPKAMQYAILIGAITSALVIGFTLLAFNAADTVYSSKPDNLPSITLTEGELAKISERETYQGTTYLVWDTRRDYDFYPKASRTEEQEKRLREMKRSPGRYLVEDNGKPAWLVDDTIMGKLNENDNGQPVKRAFDAPKTQVMGIIINGVLQQELKWDLILIGAIIAVLLEFCGVSALAFAVGVYVPIQFSTPIFIGGLIRWGVDRYVAKQEEARIASQGPMDEEAKAAAEVEAIRRSETSPGVLLAAGYIAGGSLAGMLIAFCNFNKDIPEALSTWQFRKVIIQENKPFLDVAEGIARQQLGLPAGTLTPEQKKELDAYVEEITELNQGALDANSPIKKGTKVLLPNKKELVASEDTTLSKIAKEALDDPDKIAPLLKLNKDALIPEVVVAKDSVLITPDYRRVVLERDMTLGEFAKLFLDNADEAATLYDRNKKELKLKLPAMSSAGVARIDPAETLPTGTAIKLPQKTWPALAWFIFLVGFLFLVGVGKLLKSPESNGDAKT